MVNRSKPPAMAEVSDSRAGCQSCSARHLSRFYPWQQDSILLMLETAFSKLETCHHEGQLPDKLETCRHEGQLSDKLETCRHGGRRSKVNVQQRGHGQPRTVAALPGPLAAFVDRHELAEGFAGVDLTWTADLLRWRMVHLDPMGDPARKPSHSEQDCKHLHRNPHRPVDDP